MGFSERSIARCLAGQSAPQAQPRSTRRRLESRKPQLSPERGSAGFVGKAWAFLPVSQSCCALHRSGWLTPESDSRPYTRLVLHMDEKRVNQDLLDKSKLSNAVIQRLRPDDKAGRMVAGVLLSDFREGCRFCR
jgi:hypothetical protein